MEINWKELLAVLISRGIETFFNNEETNDVLSEDRQIALVEMILAEIEEVVFF